MTKIFRCFDDVFERSVFFFINFNKKKVEIFAVLMNSDVAIEADRSCVIECLFFFNLLNR